MFPAITVFDAVNRRGVDTEGTSYLRGAHAQPSKPKDNNNLIVTQARIGVMGAISPVSKDVYRMVDVLLCRYQFEVVYPIVMLVAILVIYLLPPWNFPHEGRIDQPVYGNRGVTGLPVHSPQIQIGPQIIALNGFRLQQSSDVGSPSTLENLDLAFRADRVFSSSPRDFRPSTHITYDAALVECRQMSRGAIL